MTEEVHFVIDLRNFAQHRKLPMAGAGADIFSSPNDLLRAEPMGITIYLPSLRLDDLRTYKRWTSPSKKFLDHQRREMEIMPIINRSHEKVRHLYYWSEKRILDL